MILIWVDCHSYDAVVLVSFKQPVAPPGTFWCALPDHGFCRPDSRRAIALYKYEHTQTGTPILAITGCGVLIAGTIGVVNCLNDPSSAIVPFAIAAALAIASILFCKLTVRISADYVILRFGIGLIKKRITLQDVHAVTAVRNRWFYGWGVHLTPRGWLYNVSGFDAVEIVLKNGRKFRIVTDEPDKLLSVIRSVIEHPDIETNG